MRPYGEEQDWGRAFRRLLERHRRDDGSNWGGKSLERATRGYVSHQWVGHLRSGRIREPSFGKVVAISRAMGVPLEAWLKEDSDRPGS
ncbi:MAG: hypothetical protein M3R38_00975 [Actinomycetota bacterium]|nr:hypothetical protein [Actinomycetota bacterium]